MSAHNSPPHGLLTGLSCAVTGGARGIGAAVCRRFAEEGGRVAVCDLDVEAGDAVAAGLREAGHEAEFVHMDVADRRSVENACAAVVGRFGGVDVAVANAGILRQAPLLEMDESVWQSLIAVNLTGVFHTGQVFGRQMVQAGRGGRIVIASSIGGIQGGAHYGAYSVTKFGVIGYAQSLAVELAPRGILVNCVCPGNVDTEMMEQLAREQAQATSRTVEAVIAEYTHPIALGRYATPGEIADAYVYLASPLSTYVTGQRIVLDGGMLIT
jgi:NAD(P)-dependent dehydrogenase (short-subunit alcohol dehydrogenase family)